jgi:hypothetical protein
MPFAASIIVKIMACPPSHQKTVVGKPKRKVEGRRKMKAKDREGK